MSSSPRKRAARLERKDLRVKRASGDLSVTALQEDTPSFLPKRIRQLRLAKGWTLEDAAEKVGLSRSSLSKIERDEMSPTFQAMQRLSVGFGMDLVDLLNPEKKTPPTGRRSVTRADEGVRHEMPNYSLRFLTGELKKTAFVAIEVSIMARSLEAFSKWDKHDNEDFMYVLEGIMVLYTEHYEPVTLKTGDSVYFDARMGHACIYLGKRPARALWISSSTEHR